MTESMELLIEKIEELRAELIEIKEGRSYTDPEVVAASQKLDDILNKYQEMQEELLKKQEVNPQTLTEYTIML